MCCVDLFIFYQGVLLLCCVEGLFVCVFLYLQPISNADFIVPVEIDGTIHQVLCCVDREDMRESVCGEGGGVDTHTGGGCGVCVCARVQYEFVCEDVLRQIN